MNRLLLAVFLLSVTVICHGQSVCPPNIGFESGNFSSWQLYRGTTSTSGSVNFMNVSTVASPVTGQHTIIDKLVNQNVKDPYGNFPIFSPGGGRYSVKLGNSSTGAQAERISYTFTVPANQPDFSITYYYAVVFEDPNHPSHQQARFTAKVFDVAANQYFNCASFEYVATASLPGFQSNGTVRYKPWSPVTINLSDFAGKQIKLEFSTADCTVGGHFGYAYLDLDDDCSTVITGNNYCGQPSSVTLTGPAGFSQYNWFTGNLSQKIGTGEKLVLSPAPSSGSKFALQIIPFAGFGCVDTLYTSVTGTPFAFNVTNPPKTCAPTVDITIPAITSGSQSGLTYTHWKDPNATIPIANPTQINSSGTYYIKAVQNALCFGIKPVSITVGDPINLKVNAPLAACYSSGVDLTANAITSGSDGNLSFSYWKDANSSIALLNPKKIQQSGTYYIKAINADGCSITKSIPITILPEIIFKTNDPDPTCANSTVDLTNAAVTKGSNPDLKFSYWIDKNCSVPLAAPQNISISGNYYIKATSPTGCDSVLSIKAQFYSLPDLKINKPSPACYSSGIDITTNGVTSGSQAGLSLSYWRDANAMISISNPKKIQSTGTYYIKAINTEGCSLIKPISVTVYPEIIFKVKDPDPVCANIPIDLTVPTVTQGSSGNLSLSYWIDKNCVNPLTNPKLVSKSGIYFIKATDVYGCDSILRVNVKIYDLPNLKISNPREVCVPFTVDITEAGITSGSSNIINLTYWQDSKGTIKVSNPDKIDKSGTYYIRATSSDGCELISSVTVKINLLPLFKTQNPAAIYEPGTIDLTETILPEGQLNYSFWTDSTLTTTVQNPKALVKKGTYYITGSNPSGCSITLPVKVNIVPRAKVHVPTGFTPTEGQNNTLYPFLVGVKALYSFKIFNKWGNLIYQTSDNSKGWDGYFQGNLQLFETYTWYAEGIDFLDKYFKQSGNTILIR